MAKELELLVVGREEAEGEVVEAEGEEGGSGQ